jgi:hypothetical protein
MRPTELGKRAALCAVLGASLLAAGCSDIYFDRRDTVSFAAGDAKTVNALTHMVDPWPPRAGDRNIPHDGERMQAAAERYRTNKVTPLAGTSTSSVKYEPIIMAPSK